MTIIQVKGFKIFHDKKPPYRLRCYHRKTGHKIDLTCAPIGTAAFFAECEKIKALSDAVAAKEPKSGTLGGLLAVYWGLAHYKNLADRTKRDYRQCADFLEPILDTPAHSISTPLVAKIHDKAESKIGWKRANMLRTLLSEVFRHCVPKGLIQENYAKAVIPKPRPKGKPRANRPWTNAELNVVLDLSPPHVKAAIVLMANTGLDPSDALHLRRETVTDGVIWAKRGKTGQEATIPITPTLQAALDEAPPHDAFTVLANTRGQPWTYDGFSTVWHRFKAKLVAESLIPADLTLKGLRHTAATFLREQGIAPRKIADLLGQKTESMALHYSRNANLAENNRAAAEMLENVTKPKAEFVKSAEKSVKL